jgi:hypothetical protein
VSSALGILDVEGFPSFQQTLHCPSSELMTFEKRGRGLAARKSTALLVGNFEEPLTFYAEYYRGPKLHIEL